MTDDHGWRPIESAPRDGTAIILLEPALYNNVNVWVGRWSRGAWRDDRKGYRLKPSHYLIIPAPPGSDGDG